MEAPAGNVINPLVGTVQAVASATFKHSRTLPATIALRLGIAQAGTFQPLKRILIMARLSDAQALEHLKKLLKSRPEDSIEKVLRLGRDLPASWRQSAVAELVVWLRGRFDMTQRQLAALSGLSRAKVAQIEGGQDVQWSTLCQLFSGFGCGLTVVPTSRLGAGDLWRRTNDLWGEGHIPRRRRYPRY